MFDIGRKKKEDGIYFIGQNADDVTGSCTYIKYNGKNVKVSEITGDFKAFFRVEGAYNANWREPENFNDISKQ